MPLFDFLNELDVGNLASDSRWMIIRAGIEIAVTEGLSMSETARELRAGGLAFSNEPFRDLYRELSDYRADFSYQLRIGSDLSPNPNLMARSAFPIEGDFGYVGQWWELNEQTGFLEPRTFRVDSDELLSRNEATSELEEYLRAKSPGVFDRMIGTVEFIGSIKNSEIF